MFKFFVLVCAILLAVPVQISEQMISVDGFGTVKVTTNNRDINVAFVTNEASAVVKIVSNKTGPLQRLVGLACSESSVPVMPYKVNVIKCVYMVS
jgi:hypothetical protein